MSAFNAAESACAPRSDETCEMASVESEQYAASLLEEDHAQVDQLLRELVAALGCGDGAAAFVKLDRLWARLAVHIRAEHLCLFPALLGALSDGRGGDEELSLDEAQRMIDVLRADHDHFMRALADAVNRLRDSSAAGSGGFDPGDLCEVRQTVVALSERLTEHNRVEEGRVYRWSAILLDGVEQAALAAAVHREIGNLPPRFREGGAE